MAGNTVSIFDVSFAGATVQIDGKPIADFMDDANPIDFQDTDVCNIEWSCNGRMLRTVKPNAIMCSISVIPGSSSDKTLRWIWGKSYCNGGNVDVTMANKLHTMTITYANNGTKRPFNLKLINGTCVSGPISPTVDRTGKMNGTTYTFAFEQAASTN